MAATAHVQYAWSEWQSLDVEVCCDDGRPDILDEISHRAVFLLTESIAAVNEAASKAQADEG